MTSERHPLVSIGVPVFNGERTLRRCLDSVLSQKYGNFEVVISDNGSSDSTASICEEYCRRDARVRYVRSEVNRGAVWNFNRVFELASGKYFAWAAHDDVRDAEFLTACVEQLERHPEAVTCHTYTLASVDGLANPLYITRLDSLDRARDVVSRYRAILRHPPVMAIYGLHRAAAMRRTALMEAAMAGDVAFLQEMSLHGRFIQVPRVLFRYIARPSWNTADQDAVFFLGRRKAWWHSPFVALVMTHLRRLWSSNAVTPSVKLALTYVLTVDTARQALIKLALKAGGVVCPAIARDRVARVLHRWWLADPNIRVLTEDLYFHRVCKPQLGWWK
jgi:glycosyltransferase involved in cell wall biosynthesis